MSIKGKTMNEKITIKQAFNAMTSYLEKDYKRTNSDEVGGLLGDLLLFPDGGTFDPAAWEDWIEAVNDIVGDKNYLLTRLESFKVVNSFLKKFCSFPSEGDDVSRIIKAFVVDENDKPTNNDTWNLWLKCIKKAIENEGKPYKSPFV